MTDEEEEGREEPDAPEEGAEGATEEGDDGFPSIDAAPKPAGPEAHAAGRSIPGPPPPPAHAPAKPPALLPDGSDDDDEPEEADYHGDPTSLSMTPPKRLNGNAVKIAAILFIGVLSLIGYSVAMNGADKGRKAEQEEKYESALDHMATDFRKIKVKKKEPPKKELPKMPPPPKPKPVAVPRQAPPRPMGGAMDQDWFEAWGRRKQMTIQAITAPANVMAVEPNALAALKQQRKAAANAPQGGAASPQTIPATGAYGEIVDGPAIPAMAMAPAAANGVNGVGRGAAAADLSAVNDLNTYDRGRTQAIADMVEPPRTRYVLRTGSFIPAILIGGINSDLPGKIIGQVREDTYDTPTGRHLLIPKGSRLVGEYSSGIKYGQTRVFAVWQRIVFPDGKALDLGAMPAATGVGYAGAKDKVDNHYIRIFGSAILLSAIIAGVQYSQNNYADNDNSDRQRMGDTMSSALGQVLGQTMAEMIRRNMDIAPTLTIRPGFRMNVMLVKDLEFASPYKAFDWREAMERREWEREERLERQAIIQRYMAGDARRSNPVVMIK